MPGGSGCGGSGASRRLSIAGCCAVALAAPGCGGEGGGPMDVEPSPKATVVMVGDSYRPARVRVPVGGRVTWFNRGPDGNTAESVAGWSWTGSEPVNRESLDAHEVFDIHTVQAGEAESVEFDTPGTYRYTSSLSDMRGVVEVVGRDGGG